MVKTKKIDASQIAERFLLKKTKEQFTNSKCALKLNEIIYAIYFFSFFRPFFSSPYR